MHQVFVTLQLTFVSLYYATYGVSLLVNVLWVCLLFNVPSFCHQ